MQVYKSHKTVQAAKITSVFPDYPSPSWVLLFETGAAQVEGCIVSAEYMDKHQPKIGGYYVRYEDGYESYSPAEPFESGHTPLTAEDFEYGRTPLTAAGIRSVADSLRVRNGPVSFGTPDPAGSGGPNEVCNCDFCREGREPSASSSDSAALERLTAEQLQSKIVTVDFHRFGDTTVTVCCLTLENGFNVIGQSACIDPAQFDEALGQELAYDDAFEKLWQLEGYLLKEQLQYISSTL